MKNSTDWYVQHVHARLSELKQLEDGWLEGKHGKRFNPAALDRLERLIRDNYTAVRHRVYIYPMLDDMVELDWDVGSWRAYIELRLSDMHGAFHAFDRSTDKDQEKTLDLRFEPGWKWLCDWLERKTGSNNGATNSGTKNKGHSGLRKRT